MQYSFCSLSTDLFLERERERERERELGLQVERPAVLCSVLNVVPSYGCFKDKSKTQHERAKADLNTK
jgi:hypothetical protein